MNDGHSIGAGDGIGHDRWARSGIGHVAGTEDGGVLLVVQHSLSEARSRENRVGDVGTGEPNLHLLSLIGIFSLLRPPRGGSTHHFAGMNPRVFTFDWGSGFPVEPFSDLDKLPFVAPRTDYGGHLLKRGEGGRWRSFGI